MWISRVSIVPILLLQILSFVSSQSDPADFKHELPPGVELVNPKDFGLTEDQLGGLLSNVKVLGGSQIGGTKTQILTVGFEGDENLNFDDFDIPGLTDRKPADIPDKDKEIATVAFEKFKEFFKDPKKVAQPYQPQPPNGDRSTPQPEVQGSYAPEPKQHRNIPPQQIPPQRQHPPTNPPPRQYHHRVRTSQESLQQHYPVQLTQPHSVQNPPTSGPPPPPRRNPHHHGQQDNSQENLNNHRTQHGPPPPDSYHPQYQSAPQPPPLRQSSHAIAFSNNNQPTTNFNEEDFGAKIPSTTHVPNYHQNQQPQLKQYSSPQQNQVNRQQEEKGLQVVHQHQQTYSTLPPGNFQRFTIYSQPKAGQNPTSPPQPPPPQRTSRPQEQVGQIVRNQLLFTNNNNNNNDNDQNSYQSSPHQTQSHQHHQREEYHEQPIPGVVPPHEDPQEYRTITQNQYPQPPPQTPPTPSIQNPAPSPSSLHSTVSVLSRFPPKPDPQQRPVSHVYIQHGGGQGSPPVQQTSFHPRFQAPTRFSNGDFTPSVNHITTPSPQHYDVTPSMPMILISTNENAITDPKRMELLRRQQKAMEEKRRQQKQLQQQQVSNKDRQPHSLTYNNQQQQQAETTKSQPHYNNPATQNHITEPPRKQQNYNSQNSYTQSQYRQQYSNNQNNNNGNNHQYQSQQQNSFNFQTQQQQHQLHTLQQNLYFNSQSHPLPPRTYYQQQQQQLAQASTNYASVPIGIQPPPPPPNFHPQFYGTRQKRGYRQRLSSILRGLWRDRDY